MEGPQRISYVPLEEMTAEMQAEMERCAREGTPRPESSAVRAHVPAAFWFFARAWNDLFRDGVVDHSVKELCRVYVSHSVKCEYCGNQRSERGREQGLAEGKYDELLNFESSETYTEREKAALAYAEAIVWTGEARRRAVGASLRALQRGRARRAGMHDRPHARPAVVAAVAEHRPPSGHGGNEGLDGPRLRDRRRARAEQGLRPLLGGESLSEGGERRSPMQIFGSDIRFGVHSGPQNTSFDDYRDLWLRCEELGYDWVSDFDHFLPIHSDPAGPQFEGMTLLAGMAAHTSRVRCGMLVLGVTYRHPAVVANMAATIDHVSGGRLELGMGAAWFELEHEQYGIPFPRIGVRMDMLDEACRIMRSLWTQETTTFEGKHFQLKDARMEPKPLQERLPLVIGGSGERRTLRIVAEHGDIWNTFYGDLDEYRHKLDVLAGHCADVGRDSRRRAQVADLPRRTRRRRAGGAGPRPRALRRPAA